MLNINVQSENQIEIVGGIILDNIASLFEKILLMLHQTSSNFLQLVLKNSSN